MSPVLFGVDRKSGCVYPLWTLGKKGKRMARPMTVIADDYGIGAETSRGILELANRGILTGTVMIVNSGDAGRAVRAWKADNPHADLGWHPNLTLDRPLSPIRDVPSLVGSDGNFLPLGRFLQRMSRAAISRAEVVRELTAQHRRFVELVGNPPAVVNSHQHVSLFPPVAGALIEVLSAQHPKPYIRRVVERTGTIWKVPGARLKRAVLTSFGRRVARRAAGAGFPGCDWLAGVTDHGCVADERFWVRWLRAVGGEGSLEVCCHPGYHDESLVGRDCGPGEGLLRRTRELALLQAPSFRAAWEEAGFVPVRPSLMAA